MEWIDVLSLVFSGLALILSLFLAYINYWDYPKMVVSIKTSAALEVLFPNKLNVRYPFIFLEGFILNKSKTPLVPRDFKVGIYYKKDFINLQHLEVSNDINIPIHGGASQYQLRPNANTFDLTKLSNVIRYDEPQFFYACISVPRDYYDKFNSGEDVYLKFACVDGYGKSHKCYVNAKVNGIDLKLTPELFT